MTAASLCQSKRFYTEDKGYRNKATKVGIERDNAWAKWWHRATGIVEACILYRFVLRV